MINLILSSIVDCTLKAAHSETAASRSFLADESCAFWASTWSANSSHLIVANGLNQ